MPQVERSLHGGLKTVLVTGSRGFSGRHLVSHLRETEPELRVLGCDRCIGVGDADTHELPCNLAVFEEVRDLIASHRPDYIIHLVGQLPSSAGEDDIWASNVGACFTLLEAIRFARLRPRVVVIGSAAEYGPLDQTPVSESYNCRPADGYGRTKLAQTLLCQQCSREYGLAIMVVRPFNLFGPGMRQGTLVGDVCTQLAGEAEEIRVGPLSAARDWVDIRDAVRAYWAVARLGVAGEIYNVCTGHAVVVDEVVRTLLAIEGGDHRLISEQTSSHRPDVPYSCGDPSRIEHATGWRTAHALKASLADTLESFRSDCGWPGAETPAG